MIYKALCDGASTILISAMEWILQICIKNQASDKIAFGNRLFQR